MSKTMVNSMWKWILTLIVIAGVLLGLFFYKSMLFEAQAQQGANMPEIAATVEAQEVQTISYQKTITVNGEIQAFKRLSVSNELAGKIITLNAPSGSVVNKNQVLLELDHSDEDARLIAAKAQLFLHQQTYQRYIELQKNREISEDLVDQAKAAVEIAKSDIAVLTASIEKKIITAPFNAKVGIHNLEVGQYLDKNTHILELVGVNDFTFIDFYLAQVHQELAVGSVVDILEINQKQTYQAEVIAVDPQLSRQSRHLKYRARIASANLSLKPNTLINVAVPISTEMSLVAVADLAIVRDQLGEYVFVLEPESEGVYRAKKVKIEIGDRQDDMVLVLSGLTAGQFIATKGAFKLFPNMKVFVAPSDVAISSTPSE